MKYIPLLMLLLIGCGPEKPNPCKYIKTPTKLYMKCGDKLTLLFEQDIHEPAPPPPITDPEIPIVIEPDREPEPEPVIQPKEINEHYLYIKSFTLWRFNFVNSNVINIDGDNEFISSHTRNLPGVGEIYAKAYIREGEKLRVDYHHQSSGAKAAWYELDWTISDDFVFETWQNLNAVVKSEREIEGGVEKRINIEKANAEQKCSYLFWTTTCWWEYDERIAAQTYYFDE